VDRALKVLTLGGLSVHGRAGPLTGSAAQPRRLAVLALVARGGKRGTARGKLLSLLWPDADEDQGRKVLTQALYALRRDLGSDEAIVGTQELRLGDDAVWCDVAEFDAALSRGDPAGAVTLYVGAFLDGFRLASAPEFERWVDEERSAIRHRLHDALEQLARDAEAAGAFDRAASWWRRLAADDPLNARIAVAMMRALAAAGDRNGALRHARIFEALIAEELELPPDKTVIELAESLRREDASAPSSFGRSAQSLSLDGGSRSAPNVTSSTPRADARSIAVLPFAYLGIGDDDETQRRWRDGLSEEVLTLLAGEPSLRIAARSASFAFGHSPDLAALAATLGVALALEGSVRQGRGTVRVNARLVDVVTGATLWAERYERPLDDPHLAQDGIAEALAARVRDSIA
jgi:DNA-binding SARP family transcriptional activator/TolB-like protein